MRTHSTLGVKITLAAERKPLTNSDKFNFFIETILPHARHNLFITLDLKTV